MKRKIGYLSIIYTLFLILLLLSGSLVGILSEIVYYLAFAIPFVLALLIDRKEKTEKKRYYLLSHEKIKDTLPTVAPTLSVVILLSYLTSVLIYALTGKTNSVDLGGSFVLALIDHALIPAILEEALFRYIPLRLLAPHSRRCAVILSAVFFSLVHHNLFTIPYALAAGVIFMAIDIAADSVIPSFILHFVNNALSVGLIIFADNPAFAPVLYLILGILTVVSLCFIFVRREKYKKMLNFAFDRGEGVGFTPELAVFAVVCLSLAIISLI